MIEINKVTNARVYINGTDFIARAEEVDLPKMKYKTIELKALGLVGEADLHTIVDKMEARIKFNSVYPDFIAYAADPTKVHSVIVRAPIQVYDQNGVRVKSMRAEMRGYFKEFDTGKLKKGDNAEAEATMAVIYYKLEVDGKDIVEIDVFNNILKINGQDKLRDYRQAMGG